MFVDGNKVPHETEMHCDICIIGAGPAGISLAKEFIGQNLKVFLLESGDINFDEQTASLGEGESVGDPFSPLRDMRHRQFGGMSNIWNIILDERRIGVRHVDFDAIDFEKREWVPYSGWPISKNDLIPFYKRAHTVCQLGSYDYSPKPWETETTPRVAIKGDGIASSMFKFGPSKIFSTEYRAEIESSSNITAYTNANVVQVEAAENAKSVERVKVKCLSGNQFTVKATTFILAAGAMENARILLMSNAVQTAGLGNEHDVVGRYFMDHPLVQMGLVFPNDRHVFDSMGLYDKRRVNGETVMGKFTLTENAMRREKIMHMSAMLFPRDKSYKSETKESAKALVSSVRRGRVPSNVFRHLRNVAFHTDELISDWYKYRIKQEVVKPNLAFGNWSTTKVGNRYEKFEVLAVTEQAPHPDNRVTLSTRLDRLGYPQVKLTNYWSEIDKESVRKGEAIFAHEFASSDFGKIKIEPLERQDVLMSTHHNMGTTRMSSNPKTGVVDANCKVHGISNLFVAGSSVFPTGGIANPTLTIVALAIRLADHLKSAVMR